MRSPRFGSPPLLFATGLISGGLITCLALAALTRNDAVIAPPNRSASTNASVPQAASTLLHLPPRLAEPEADAALAAYLALPPLAPEASPADYADRAARLRALLTLLPSTHLPKLLAILATRAGAAEARLRDLAFTAWTELGAPAAATWLRDLTPTDTFPPADRARLLRQAALAWADTDFDAALAFTSALTDAKLAQSVLTKLLGKLASTDPARAIALAQARGPEFLEAARLDIFNAWRKTDPASALRTFGAALLENDPYSWQSNEAVNDWLARDLNAALDWLARGQGRDPEKANEFFEFVLLNAGSVDALDLASLAKTVAARTDLTNRLDALSSVLHALRSKSPDAALAWLDSLPDAAERADLLARALPTKDNSPKVENNLPLAFRLPPGPDRDEKISNYLTAWAARDPDAALAWLRAHNDPSLAAVSKRLEGGLVGNLASIDLPAALARWQTLPDREARLAAAPAIATAIGRTDPAEATRWLGQQLADTPSATQNLHLYTGGDLSTALRSTLGRWYEKDPAAAIAWVQTLPDTNAQSSALYHLGREDAFTGKDAPPRAAFADQLATVSNADLRQNALTNHLLDWLSIDPTSALRWLDTHDALTPEQTATLLKQAKIKLP